MKGVAKLAPGPGNVELAERPEPEVRAGYAILEVHGTGICGTDLHIWDDEFPSEPPVTMGHEVCGTVAEVGDGADSSLLGRRVVTETYFTTCGVCDQCRNGRSNLCAERRSIGSREDGGFAARLLVPAAGLHVVPDWLPSHAAALSEPLACVCQCLLDPPVIAAGDTVLVTGPGPIGLLAAQVARASGGVATVVGMAHDRVRLELAEHLGFATASPGGTLGDAFDVAVECSGTAAGIASCFDAVRPRGRLVQIGLSGKPIEVPFDRVCLRELIVTGGNASTTTSWRRALALVRARAVDLEALVSDVVPLEEFERAFAAARSGAAVKVVLAP